MARGQTADIYGWRPGDHITLHVDGQRPIFGALDIGSRNASETFRCYVHLGHQCRERLWAQPRLRVRDVCVRAVMVENVADLVRRDRSADPVGMDCDLRCRTRPRHPEAERRSDKQAP
jgi:hypothetical protein